MSKFVTCSPSPRDCGGVSHSKRHSYYGFRLCGTKWLFQNFDLLTWEKNERGRGPRCSPIFFGYLKRALELFISVRRSPPCDTLGPVGRYFYDPWKKKQTNKHALVICLLAKNTNFHILVDWSLNCCYRVLWYAEYDGVIFVKILWRLGVFPPIFQNKANFLRLVTFDDKDWIWWNLYI